MKRLTVLLVLLALLFIVQCEWPEEDDEAEPLPLCDECLDAAPDEGSLTIRIPGDDNEDYVTQTVGDLAEFYTDTRQISRDLNFWILGTLGWLDEILTVPPTENEDGFCVWGPFIPEGLSPVEARFRMQRHSADDYDYFWEERPKNTNDDWWQTWGGSITPATSTARRGIGNLTIDFDAARELDPTRQEAGTMDVDYDTISDGRRIDISFSQFQDLRPDHMDEPMDADYHYHNRADNSGEFEFVFFLDIHQDDWGDAYPEKETVTTLTQWQTDGAGGATRVVEGGDLAQVEVEGFTIPLDRIDQVECWDAQFARTYYRMDFVFTDGQTATIEEEGDPETCVF